MLSKGASSLLILTRIAIMTLPESFRGLFNRRILLWEGHTRPGLERLVESLRGNHGDCVAPLPKPSSLS